jgi:hypothetical protein
VRESVCSRMLTYAHMCSRMLTYAHVCSRVSTYAGEDEAEELSARERSARLRNLTGGPPRPLEGEFAMRYQCAADVPDLSFYACAGATGANSEEGGDTWKQQQGCKGCATCPTAVAGVASSRWSNAFRPRCERATNSDPPGSTARVASLLEFAANEGGSCSGSGGVDGETLRTTKAWSGCSTCLDQGNCKASAVCGFDKSSLTVRATN